MFISRIHLNPQRAATKSAAGNINKLHGAVLNTVAPTVEGTRPEGMLWRLDTGKYRHTLYVVSPTEPDFSAIQEQYGWSTEEGKAEVRDYNPRLESLRAGQRLAFRITANPTHTVVYPNELDKKGNPRRRRIAHETHAHQVGWLAQRSGACGFSLPGYCPAREVRGKLVGPSDNVRTSPLRVERFVKSGSTPVTIGMVTFDGVLEVTDADKFRASLVNGVGRGKAYGCGLLTVANLV